MANFKDLKKYHFIYKTTNLLNGKFYIGMHSTSNIKDGYLGSGTRLRHAIRKYGENNFKLEILEFCLNRNSLIEREKELVNGDLLKDSMCMNLKPGGQGGFNNTNHQFKCSQSAGIKHREKLLNDLEYRKSYSKKISDANKRRYQRGELELTLNYDWTGKKHKKETIEKMKQSKIGHGIGQNNSNFGSFWITDGVNNKMLKKYQSIPNGWSKGRKIYSNKK